VWRFGYWNQSTTRKDGRRPADSNATVPRLQNNVHGDVHPGREMELVNNPHWLPATSYRHHRTRRRSLLYCVLESGQFDNQVSRSRCGPGLQSDTHRPWQTIHDVEMGKDLEHRADRRPSEQHQPPAREHSGSGGRSRLTLLSSLIPRHAMKMLTHSARTKNMRGLLFVGGQGGPSLGH
jgi:hypothetical protein